MAIKRTQTKGSYFVFQFVAPTEEVYGLKSNLRLDGDLLRNSVFKLWPYNEVTCSLEEELKPPAYRDDVKKMVKEAEDRKPSQTIAGEYPMITGLDHYPFSH